MKEFFIWYLKENEFIENQNTEKSEEIQKSTMKSPEEVDKLRQMKEKEYNEKQKKKHLKFEFRLYKLIFLFATGTFFAVVSNDFKIFSEYAEVVALLKSVEPKANAIFIDIRENSRKPEYLIKMESEESITIDELFQKYDPQIDKIIKYLKQPLLLPMVCISLEIL